MITDTLTSDMTRRIYPGFHSLKNGVEQKQSKNGVFHQQISFRPHSLTEVLVSSVSCTKKI